MTISAGESLEAIAASRVLQRLGSQMYDVVKMHLKHRYGIRLDEGSRESFSLTEFGYALHQLIGTGAAELILQDVYVELDELSSQK